MPHHRHATESHKGTIRDIFAHRFIIDTDNGPVLANVSPHAPDAVKLKQGAKVKITGEKSPSEIKVYQFQSGSGPVIEIPHGKPKKDHHHPEIDPIVALDAAREAGYEIHGKPHRKPKHFELDAVKDDKEYELHITLDGYIRKAKSR